MTSLLPHSGIVWAALRAPTLEMRKRKVSEVMEWLDFRLPTGVGGRGWLQAQAREFISSLQLPGTLLLRAGKRDVSRIRKAAGREVRSIKSSAAIPWALTSAQHWARLILFNPHNFLMKHEDNYDLHCIQRIKLRHKERKHLPIGIARNSGDEYKPSGSMP